MTAPDFRRVVPQRTGPDRDAALAQYRRRARVYDLELAAFEPIRRDAVRRLVPRRGETVVDVGCGTGLSLPLLRDAVGTRGRSVGVEQSPAMLALACRRVAAHRWRNVEPVGAPVETADWPWALLESRLGPMRVTTSWLGAVYIAEGSVP